MKRKSLLLCALVLALLLGGCGTGAKAPEKTLRDQGLDVVALMEEMLRSEAYEALMTGGADLREVAALLREGSYSSPEAVYQITPPEDALGGMLAAFEADAAAFDGASAALKEALGAKALASLATQLNARSGVAYLAASALYTAEKVFVSEETTQAVVYIYTYADAYPVVVTFSPGEGGAVSALGSFILDKGFAADKESLEEQLSGVYELAFLNGSGVERLPDPA